MEVLKGTMIRSALTGLVHYVIAQVYIVLQVTSQSLKHFLSFMVVLLNGTLHYPLRV